MAVPANGINLENEGDYLIDVGQLTAAAYTVISQHGLNPLSSVQIVIADNETVRKLNATYRDTDSVTDVLSFTADPLPPEILAQMGEAPHLGDLIIAYPYASAQAFALDHAVGDSLALLVVHGTLHLIGYDHDTPENKAKMWAAQARALSVLGISESIVPALEDASHD